ncbi:DJ-1 family glyoxalase III [Haloimpatiens sp. FM7330]|uniref:DJ-1 family glyoxalase III n=1 Tax=Haloimpatiens sp. FM7330 TaxID=3298610 RepID=UPI0036409C47
MSKALVFLANGFEEIEALTCVDVLRRAQIDVDTCSIKNKTVLGTHNIEVKSDKIIDEINIEEYDAVILPGGMPGAANLKEDKKVIEAIKKLNSENKIVSAICAAPIVLAEAGVIENRRVTSYPGFEDQLGNCKYVDSEKVVQDGNIITSRGPATAIYFALQIVENLKGTKVAKELKNGMLLNFVEDN